MKFVLIILVLLNSFSLIAQNKVNMVTSAGTLVTSGKYIKQAMHKKKLDIFHNWAYPGRNLSLQYVHYWGRHALTGGIKYQINGKNTIEDFTFTKHFYANPAIERLGISIGYQFNLVKLSLPHKLMHKINPFLFGNIQYGFLGIRNTHYIVDSQNSTSTIETVYMDNFMLFEFTMGAGVEAKVYKRFYANGGIGLTLAKFKPTFNPIGNPYFNDWRYITEGSFIYRLGVSYLLN